MKSNERYFSLKVSKYHPICSNYLLTHEYRTKLLGSDLTVIPGSIAFKRQFLAAQLSLVDGLCTLANETMHTSLTLFLRQQFITAQALTADQFYEQMNTIIDRLILDTSFSFYHTLDYLQAATHGNAIMSSYVSNWQFTPSDRVNASAIRTRPVQYGNCSCAMSDQCSTPMSVNNVTFTGLAIGCLPLPVLLQSTLECFYNQTCLDALHYALFDDMSVSSLPTSVPLSSRFPSNISVRFILNELFIENWFRQTNYEKYFQICQVATCTYIYNKRADILYVITTIIGFLSGLITVFRLICPLVIVMYFMIANRIQKIQPTPTDT